MAAAADCPSPNELERLARAQLLDSERQPLIRHVATCRACADRLELLLANAGEQPDSSVVHDPVERAAQPPSENVGPVPLGEAETAAAALAGSRLYQSAFVGEAAQRIRHLGYFATDITEVPAPTRAMNKLLALATGPFGKVIRLFERLFAKPSREGSEAKLPAQETAGSQELAPKPAPIPKAQAAARDRRLGQVLVELGFIDEDQLWELIAEARAAEIRLGHLAVARGTLTEEQLVQALAEQFGLRVTRIDEITPTADAIRMLPETMARFYKILPMSIKDGVLTVITSDPANRAVLDDLRDFLGVKEVQAMVASAKQIEAATPRFYAGREESILDLINEFEQVQQQPDRETSIDLESLMEIQAAAPVRKLLNMVMLLAIKDHASDIHFEPFEDEYKMRYRCDGVLYEMVPPPRHLATEIADRIKVMANLDVAERRKPQHGRIELNVGGNPVDLRVSVLPTMFGDSVVIRVLDPTIVSFDLTRVGIGHETLREFRELIHEPDGMILVAGPAGAGKTTTLYSALAELTDATKKIIAAEDPVEYSSLEGIVRCPIRDDLGFTRAMPSILRQEPDIIVVGEIRDLETAQVAVQAALGGRRVFSTVRAADAASSITRLRGMGLEPSLIAATVKGILALRLVRKICEDCRMVFEPSPGMLMELNLRPQDVSGRKFYYGRGCDRCNNTGHKGHRAINELVVMNDELREMICAGASTDQLRTAYWGQGIRTLREAGLDAIYEGTTTIDEVAGAMVLIG